MIARARQSHGAGAAQGRAGLEHVSSSPLTYESPSPMQTSLDTTVPPAIMRSTRYSGAVDMNARGFGMSGPPKRRRLRHPDASVLRAAIPNGDVRPSAFWDMPDSQWRETRRRKREKRDAPRWGFAQDPLSWVQPLSDKNFERIQPNLQLLMTLRIYSNTL